MSSLTGKQLASLTSDARDAAMALTQDRYPERVAPWRELIVGLSKAHGISLVDATYTLVKDLQGQGLLDGAAAMWLMAALAEEALAATEVKG